jgi:hypothetical protein
MGLTLYLPLGIQEHLAIAVGPLGHQASGEGCSVAGFCGFHGAEWCSLVLGMRTEIERDSVSDQDFLLGLDPRYVPYTGPHSLRCGWDSRSATVFPASHPAVVMGLSFPSQVVPVPVAAPSTSIT